MTYDKCMIRIRNIHSWYVCFKSFEDHVICLVDAFHYVASKCYID